MHTRFAESHTPVVRAFLVPPISGTRFAETFPTTDLTSRRLRPPHFTSLQYIAPGPTLLALCQWPLANMVERAVAVLYRARARLRTMAKEALRPGTSRRDHLPVESRRTSCVGDPATSIGHRTKVSKVSALAPSDPLLLASPPRLSLPPRKPAGHAVPSL